MKSTAPQKSANKALKPWDIAIIALIGAVVLYCLGRVFLFWLVILIPVGLVVIPILMLGKRSTKATALRKAETHLGTRESKTFIEETIGSTGTLVINDWGMVLSRIGQASIEISWSDIQSVDEPRPYLLRIHSQSHVPTDIDLAGRRFFLIARTIFERFPGKTDFDVNPTTGESNLLKKLAITPREWKWMSGHLVISNQGVSYNNRHMRWDEIQLVEEWEKVETVSTYTGGDRDGGSAMGTIDSTMTTYYLTFRSARDRFEIKSLDLADGPNGDLDVLRDIVDERIPGKSKFSDRGPTAAERARHWLKTSPHWSNVDPHNQRDPKDLDGALQKMFELCDSTDLPYQQVLPVLEHHLRQLRAKGQFDDAAKLERRIQQVRQVSDKASE